MPSSSKDHAPLGEMPDESDYEYEYDDSQTETVYVTLDLSSYNGPMRPPRKRSSASVESLVSSGDAGSSHIGSPTPDKDEVVGGEPDLDVQLQNQIQIMELHSSNPIVSYQNQFFSCSWGDQIGTDMLFLLPDAKAELPILRRTQNFDLITTTRVKVLGQKSHLISGASLSQARRMQPGAVATGQAQFLECLIQAKRAKGEVDIVRTAFPHAQKRSQALDEKLQGWARTEGMLAELEEFSQRARDGDPSAMRRLGEIYAQFDAAMRNNSRLGVITGNDELPIPSVAQQDTQTPPNADANK
ncbi:hypothetical protein LOZ51_004741 [Ophidiomyces ophidiicola]|nr:hypothetical protein LOZ55_003419 [Ophidiomyces ophidiicola]KAI1983043.1 hypothetical protein LOZ54_005114 [Ophidiomyces ophidiicola]KAI1991208.1 hypothetical protein LOZ51_004741 [Ophidiomyces ophidiicola]